MVFVGAVVLPHGAMSFDGQGNESASISCRNRFAGLPEDLKAKLSSLFASCVKAAECIAKLEPDVIVLHTPHGVSLSKSLGVYFNDVAKGSALWNDQWSEIEVELTIDKEIASKIVSRLLEDKIEVEGINCFTRTEAPLRWGEVVPMWYLQEQFKKSYCPPKYVILSQSMKKHLPNINEERIAVGKALAEVFSSVDAKVVLAISGDLSHAHKHSYDDIPLYLADPRWNMPQSDKAETFDRAIEGWARCCDYHFATSNDELPLCADPEKWDPVLAKKWLKLAADLQSVALSCGIGGLFVLHGVLSQYCESSTVHSKFFGRYAPTYYGMMAAVFSF